MCSAKNCTVGQYSTYDHVQGMLAGRVEGSSEGSWQPSNYALRKLGGTHTLIENCLKDGQRYCLMYS